MIETLWIEEPIEVDQLPTGLLLTFIQHHQQRLTELQTELITRVKLQTTEGAEKHDEPTE